MTRFRLTIEYDGTPYVGWQRQDSGPTVQAAIETAIQSFAGEKLKLYCAGRTDSGVHALGQVAHFDIPRETTSDTVRDALNHFLKNEPITILSATEVDDEFHARFSAVQRSYLYRILNRRPPPALERDFVWWVAVPLDVTAMRDASQVLVGSHDFTTFRATQCGAKSPMKTIDRLTVATVGEEIHIEVRARSFLHHQVRNIAGSLRLVGEGKWRKADLAAALAAKRRSAGGPTAPPQGLCLIGVGYRDDASDTAK